MRSAHRDAAAGGAQAYGFFATYRTPFRFPLFTYVLDTCPETDNGGVTIPAAQVSIRAGAPDHIAAA